MSEETADIELTVNGVSVTKTVPVRRHLVDFLRLDLDLTGSHLACEHGVCGACTVRVDGAAVRGCLMLAVQADGAEVVTIEGLAQDGNLHPLQQAFIDHGALQCGFCTPGLIMSAKSLLDRNPNPDEQEVRLNLAGNLCRCTGYDKVVRAVLAVAQEKK